MVLSRIIIVHMLVTKIMFIWSRSCTICTILITTVANYNWNYNLNENNHSCYKLNSTRIGVYIANGSSIIDSIDTNFDKCIINIYNIIETCQIANKMNNFCPIIKLINVIQLIIHLLKTLHVTTTIITELYLFIYCHL